MEPSDKWHDELHRYLAKFDSRCDFINDVERALRQRKKYDDVLSLLLDIGVRMVVDYKENRVDLISACEGLRLGNISYDLIRSNLNDFNYFRDTKVWLMVKDSINHLEISGNDVFISYEEMYD